MQPENNPAASDRIGSRDDREFPETRRSAGGRRGLRSLRLAVIGCICFSRVAAAQTDLLHYNRDIRPILAENCFACHGPDSASRKADLRLDQRDRAIERRAIVPGQPAASQLITRITHADLAERMPPAETGKRLTTEQKSRLQRWVAAGAEYEPHWSYIAPRRGELPPIRNAGWVRNPIDRFVLARLESAGLAPAPEADRHTLARRLSLDLTGLPPAPELVARFIADTSESAYEKLVDQLIESQSWGEHRARAWLDAARYADTHGLHFDNFREMWSYRDWVIGAFNRNLPFDRFTIEQLGGDLLPSATLEQQIASGFNRCNMTTNEGGTIAEENLVHYTRDRTETVSIVWLGMTANCATCHDHKFDPLTQREFYELSAFFNNTTQGAMDGNVRDTPPIIVVPLPNDRTRWNALKSELPAAKQLLDSRTVEARPDFDSWLAAATPDTLGSSLPQDAICLHAPLNEGDGKVTKVTVDGTSRDVSVSDSAQWQPGFGSTRALQVQGTAAELPDAADFERDQPFACAAWIKLPAAESTGAICSRMDNDNGYRGWDFWVQRRQVGAHIVNRWPDDAVKVVARAQIPANEWTHVAVTYDGSAKAAGVTVYYNGKPQETLVEADRLQSSSSIRTPVAFKIGQRHTAQPLTGTLHDLRIYRRRLPPSEVASLANLTRFTAFLAKPPEQRSDSERNEVFQWWLGTFDRPYRERTDAFARLEREQSEIKSRGTIGHVMNERADAPMAHVLFRGEYDKRREAVQAATPKFLPAFPAELPKNRLGLAQWLLHPEQPLTARVAVNRYWQEVFGTGLVRTSGDFGVAGELPSHPELLDWLAVEFRESEWNVKQFFKLLVTSATYRQAAAVTPLKIERDPNNRLLSRGPRYRLDAEMIRDYALAASGLLVPTVGGPSVRPYQPNGIWEAVAIIGSNTREYRRDAGPSLYRRSLYTFWKRSAPPASMEILNAPNREICTVRRERTNTPLQALVTLNDPQFVEAARLLAERTLTAGGESDDSRTRFIAERVLCRPLTANEQSVLRSELDALLAYYAAHADDAKALLSVGESKPDESLVADRVAAWTMLANQLLNLDEVLNK